MPAISTMKNDDWTPAMLAEAEARRRRLRGIGANPGFCAKARMPDKPKAATIEAPVDVLSLWATFLLHLTKEDRPDDPKPDQNKIKIRDVQDAVCFVFGIPRSVLLSRRREAKVVLPRHLAFYLCRLLTERSLPEIGQQFGGMDHTSVLNGVRKFEPLYPFIKELVDSPSKDLVAIVRAAEAARGILFSAREREKRERLRQINTVKSHQWHNRDKDDTFRSIGEVAQSVVEKLENRSVKS